MKSTIATLALSSLLGPVSVFARPADTPVRVLPWGWKYEITALKGPGCSDFGKPDYDENHDRHTRLTFGENTVDGSEVYYWYIAMPSLRVELGESAAAAAASTWCEAEIKYTELKDNAGTEASDYRLRLHKNGTKAIAVYDLAEDVKATLSLTYLDADITDTLTLNGPAKTEAEYGAYLYLTGGKEKEEYKLPACGAATIKIRSELRIEGGKEGSTSTVASEAFKDDKGVHYYGTQYGFSYDWEKCAN
ncbi:hypothetical protein F5Y17DRAFT_208068 [Xylariaceae sp. FL0594]|nr:hypothetical protein F5Y17DRAFT_208068 [Xylariaceae sp. FL0594]